MAPTKVALCDVVNDVTSPISPWISTIPADALVAEYPVASLIVVTSPSSALSSLIPALKLVADRPVKETPEVYNSVCNSLIASTIEVLSEVNKLDLVLLLPPSALNKSCSNSLIAPTK